MLELGLITLRKLRHFFGSCPNHFRSSVLGAISFNQRSTFAFSLVKPRGQSLSTRDVGAIVLVRRFIHSLEF